MLPQIFPLNYKPEIDYNIRKFEKNQQYLNNHNFKKLAKGINEIIDRF